MKILLFILLIVTANLANAQLLFQPDEDFRISDIISPEIIKQHRINEITINEYCFAENIDALTSPRIILKYYFNKIGYPISRKKIEFDDTTVTQDLSDCALLTLQFKTKKCDSLGRLIFAENSLSHDSIHKLYDKLNRIKCRTYTEPYYGGEKKIKQAKYYYSTRRLDSIISTVGRITRNDDNKEDTLNYIRCLISFKWSGQKLVKLTINFTDSEAKYPEGTYFYVTFGYINGLLTKVEERKKGNLLIYRATIRYEFNH